MAAFFLRTFGLAGPAEVGLCSDIMNHLTSAARGCQRLTSKHQAYINLTLNFKMFVSTVTTQISRPVPVANIRREMMLSVKCDIFTSAFSCHRSWKHASQCEGYLHNL